MRNRVAPGGILPAGSNGALCMVRGRVAGRQSAPMVDWPAVLEAFGVGVLILSPHADEHLVQQFQARPSWAVDFRDEDAVVFVRTCWAVQVSEPIQE